MVGLLTNKDRCYRAEMEQLVKEHGDSNPSLNANKTVREKSDQSASLKISVGVSLSAPDQKLCR